MTSFIEYSCALFQDNMNIIQYMPYLLSTIPSENKEILKENWQIAFIFIEVSISADTAPSFCLHQNPRERFSNIPWLSILCGIHKAIFQSYWRTLSADTRHRSSSNDMLFRQVFFKDVTDALRECQSHATVGQSFMPKQKGM